jgi:hypothetical protein
MDGKKQSSFIMPSPSPDSFVSMLSGAPVRITKPSTEPEDQSQSPASPDAIPPRDDETAADPCVIPETPPSQMPTHEEKFHDVSESPDPRVIPETPQSEMPSDEEKLFNAPESQDPDWLDDCPTL